MDENPAGGGVAGSNSSSDFVRKLYKMLEDPSHSSVVRWGDEMDSFVVLENERFTKAILPKHFKHSNFASFVRQLNKYDFHKVRQNTEDTSTSPYGPGAWEFKHPEFKANNKDALENIKRKAPAPRKAAPPAEIDIPTQQMDLVNTQLIATQQQLQQLQERYNELSMHHSMLLQELIGVQKTVVTHENVLQHVMHFLHAVDAKQRRDSKGSGAFAAGVGSDGVVSGKPVEAPPQSPDGLPASPLANASKILNDLHSDVQLNYRNLEHMNDMHNRTISISTPPPDSMRSLGRPPASAGSSTSMQFAKLSNDLDHVVYPAGQTNGIDPMYSEHVHNIPYTMPPKDAGASDPRQQFGEGRKKSAQLDPGWLRPPQILLVEDDPTCRRIGGKFLYSFHCHIDTAFDGLEAVNKMNTGSQYDMVLMDIIMPNLDGVSACHLIRQFDNTPIIAMTSNIRSDDIAMYFQHGMNDVLPKPFTREGLLSMLEKHLGHLKKMPGDLDLMPNSASTVGPTSTARSIKDDTSPGESPSTMSTTWNSPATFTGVSPTATTAAGPYVQQLPTPTGFGMDAGGMSFPPQTPHSTAAMSAQASRLSQRRPLSEMTGVDEVEKESKRARLYAQTAGTMSQARK